MVPIDKLRNKSNNSKFASFNNLYLEALDILHKIKYKATMKTNFDTKDIPQKTLYENTTAVFQKYQRYQMTLKENITISQNNKDYEKSILDNICEVAGINKDDSTFTDGYETMLSREFGGVDLSGGQWRRIAIARGLFRSHNLIGLDEPTAAIDPYEETRIYNRFAEISRDKSAAGTLYGYRNGIKELIQLPEDKPKVPTNTNLAAELPTFDITLNGVKIDNSNRLYPFIVYNDITYFPMTYLE